MKKIIIAVVLAGMSATGYAADFSELQSFKAANVKVSTVDIAPPADKLGGLNNSLTSELGDLPAQDNGGQVVAFFTNCGKESALIMLEQALAAIKSFNVTVSKYGLVDSGGTYSDPRYSSYIKFSGERVMAYNSEYFYNYKPNNARHTQALLRSVNGTMESYSNVMKGANLRTASVGAVGINSESGSGFRFGILYHPEGATRLREIPYSIKRDEVIGMLKNKGYSFVGNSYVGTRDVVNYVEVLTDEDYRAKRMALENDGNEILMVSKNPEGASIAEYTITYLKK